MIRTQRARAVAAFLIGVVLLACATPATAGRVVPSGGLPLCDVRPGQGAPGRAVIFIQGMFSRGTSETMWDSFTRELADIYGGFVYFSYSGRAHDYGPADTLESIAEHDLPLLYELIASCRLRGWTSFDLIGHSKGGVVATEYLKAHGFTGEQAGLVQHVITLDAPVNGSELAWLLAQSPATGMPSPWGSDAGTGKGVFELAQMFEERDSVQRRNYESGLHLQELGGCLLTLTNNQDAAVSPADALIPGFGKSHDLGTDLRGDTGRALGHHRTLDVPNKTSELQDIRDCLAGREIADSRSAQPLPGLARSLAAFVSDAAHQLVLLLPIVNP